MRKQMGSVPLAIESTRLITVLAEDPTVLGSTGKPLMTRVRIPNETLLPGPRGSRIEVIDYDATTGHFYTPADINQNIDLLAAAKSASQIEKDPRMHAQHVYGVAAATLFEFEKALGRSLSWGFAGRSHQLKIAPHAFQEANAFYSREDEALLFGYFTDIRKKSGTVFTCLSHDIVAHEVTHALLDGLRDQLMRPSHPQQAAFHEGYADIVALLSILRSDHLIQYALENQKLAKNPAQRIDIDKTLQAISSGSILTGLARQMGNALSESIRRDALRRSLEDIKPDPKLLEQNEEPHDLGEILVAIVMHAYLEVWAARLNGKFKLTEALATRRVEAWRVAEEGAKAAQHLLTMVIRAIDYLPCVHLTFADFLKALITSDWQTCGDDSNYHYRMILRAAFAKFGIIANEKTNTGEAGTYDYFDKTLQYGHGNSESLRWDRDGMFRFIWQNRVTLGLNADAYTRVNSVRSVWRVAPHGQIIRETVAEFYQLIKQADLGTLQTLGIPKPRFINAKHRFDLVGGGTLVFDEFGALKFYIPNHLDSKKQKARLEYLSQQNALTLEDAPDHAFALSHRHRAGKQAINNPKQGDF